MLNIRRLTASVTAAALVGGIGLAYAQTQSTDNTVTTPPATTTPAAQDTTMTPAPMTTTPSTTMDNSSTTTMPEARADRG